ncbi:hypothetical protein AUP42_07605 [Thalassospira lucentensis]|uniref:DUF4167 domain-containing protein n=2 Tax=Thalassospira lucentensis TaxID=168935 RepID=A0A154L0Q5_9PROT|nr:hypothetical protein AUP42_07605 [Thalassospira lucentensis]
MVPGFLDESGFVLQHQRHVDMRNNNNNNNNKRPRGRQQPNKRPVNPKFQTFDSNGPDGRVRGNAQQVYEKYVSLAKDCTDDPVLAENYYQHAEHYHRILQAAIDWENQRREERGDNNNPRPQRNDRNDRNDRGNNRPNRDERSENQNGDDSNDNSVSQDDVAASADNTSNDTGNNSSDGNDVAASAAAPSADSNDGDAAPVKRAPRARRAAPRGRPPKAASEDSDQPSLDIEPADNADTDTSADSEEKKPRKAAAATSRTRGRHPTARRGRSRAAGREDGEEGSSEDKSAETVSA